MPGQASLMGLAALALTLAWVVLIPAVAGEPEVGKNCPKECLPTDFASKPIPAKKLQSYEKITCKGKTAVILLTKMNRSFCARPEEKWVQSAMKQLDLRNASPPSKTSTPVTTLAPTLGHDHPIGTVAYRTSTQFPERRTIIPDRSVVNTTPVGPEATSQRPPEKSGVGATFKPGKTDQTHGSGTTRGLATSPTFIGTQRTANGSSGVQNYTRSSLQPTVHPSSSSSHITDSVEKGMVPSATSTMFLTSPSVPTSVLGTGDKLQTTTGLTNWFQTDQSSTRSSMDGNNTRPINVEDRSDGMRNSSVAFGGTSGIPSSTEASFVSELPASQPTSGFHQENVNEKSRAQATTYSPEVTLALFPGGLAGYRTHIISLVGAGLLFVASAVVGWLWMKSSLSATTLSKEMVEGLLYNSPNSQTDEHAMRIL
ncbi:fractalkine isoform X2 [Sceloporus undulatus]|uniref:fractalkine isoform X2 n=1 Tax=Sceloporus undulatus TaxID=8520 RepID=UPI001C4B208F|nr:fractalkine isoform X2 [Sceloporus undulatus]